jgi:hypothetical protein
MRGPKPGECQCHGEGNFCLSFDWLAVTLVEICHVDWPASRLAAKHRTLTGTCSSVQSIAFDAESHGGGFAADLDCHRGCICRILQCTP